MVKDLSALPDRNNHIRIAIIALLLLESSKESLCVEGDKVSAMQHICGSRFLSIISWCFPKDCKMVEELETQTALTSLLADWGQGAVLEVLKIFACASILTAEVFFSCQAAMRYHNSMRYHN